MKILTLIAFFANIFFAPWFFAVAAGILLLGVWRVRVFVILGGVLMDVLFGIPIASFGGFSFFYTALFMLLVACEFVLRKRVID